MKEIHVEGVLELLRCERRKLLVSAGFRSIYDCLHCLAARAWLCS